MLYRILATTLSLLGLSIVSLLLLVVAPLALAGGDHLARLCQHLNELRTALSAVLLRRKGA